MALDLPEPAGPTTTMPCRTWQVSCSCRHLLSQGPCACRPASRMAERRAAWMPPAGTFSGFCPGKTSSSSLRKSGRSALTSLLVFMSRNARMSSWSSDLGAAVGGVGRERGCESLVSTLQFGSIRAPLAIAIFSLENPTLPNSPYTIRTAGGSPASGHRTSAGLPGCCAAQSRSGADASAAARTGGRARQTCGRARRFPGIRKPQA